MPRDFRFKSPYVLAGGLLALVVVSAFLFVSCSRRGEEPPHVPLPRIEFIGSKNQSGPVLVFVHGLAGDGKDTWTNSRTQANWPELVAHDETFAGATIAVYWYNTAIFDRSFGLDDHARQMTEVFKDENLMDRQFVFVCHSMGGLLVRRFLLMHQDRSKNVQMLCFLGTPFEGSSLASPATLLSSNPTIQEMLRSSRETHSWLDEQHSQWVEGREVRGIPAYCGYETVDYHGLRVVDERSGRLIANRKNLPFQLNHIDLCKPATKDDLVYKFLANAYKETTPKLNTQSVKPWPTEEECKEKLSKAGLTPDRVLNPREEAAGTRNDIKVTIDNGSRQSLCIIFYDAAALYDPKAGTKCAGFMVEPDYAREQKRYLSRFLSAKGWFLVFLRYRADDGTVQDDFQSVEFLFGSLDPYFSISRTDTKQRPYKLTKQLHPPPSTN